MELRGARLKVRQVLSPACCQNLLAGALQRPQAEENTDSWREGLKCEGLKEGRRSTTHLVGLSHGAVVEAEEVDELIQELADAGAGDVHRAAQRLARRNTQLTAWTTRGAAQTLV